MKKTYSTLMTLLVLTFALSAHAKFAGVEKISVQKMEGKLKLTCQYSRYSGDGSSGSGWANWDCKQNKILPGGSAYFTQEEYIEGAKYVELRFERPLDAPEQGPVKRFKYSSKKKRSKYPILLSVGENGILSQGINKVRYSILNKKKQVLKVGQFEMEVATTKSVSCPEGKLFSTTPGSCAHSNKERMCRRYFSYYQDRCQ